MEDVIGFDPNQIIKAYVPLVCRLLIVVWIDWHFFFSDIVRECSVAK